MTGLDPGKAPERRKQYAEMRRAGATPREAARGIGLARTTRNHYEDWYQHGCPPPPVQARCAECDRAPACDGLNVCAQHVEIQLGITYRQLDYWTRLRLVRPDVATPGSGYNRSWPAVELEIARRIGVLVKAGLPLSWAAEMARNTWPSGELAPGIRVAVTA